MRLSEHSGTTRSAQNALRHGLTRVSSRHPMYQEDIYTIARMMCAGDGSPELFERAVRVAECDILIREIRAYCARLIARLLDPHSFPISQARIERKLRIEAWQKSIKADDRLRDAAPGKGASPEKQAEFDKLADEFFAVPEDRKLETAFVLSVPELVRLSRYERRAWSRRKREFLHFMAIQGGYKIRPVPMVTKEPDPTSDYC